MSSLKKIALESLRQSFLRKSILSLLVALHNTSYKWIGIFSAYEGHHPKHCIQNYHQFFLDNISTNNRVLDIGSGTGAVAFDMATKAAEVTGIDIAKKNVLAAQKQYIRKNLRFIQGDATTFHFEKNFDVITLSNVLEHIEHRHDFLKNIQKLAPKLLIRVPLITRDWISVWKKENGFEYRLDDTHYIEYTEENFAEEMKRAGLQIESLKVTFGELYAVLSHKSL